jgi:hypothetical protein
MLNAAIEGFAQAVVELTKRYTALASHCRDSPQVLKAGDAQTIYAIAQELQEFEIAITELRDAAKTILAAAPLIGEHMRALAHHGFAGDDVPTLKLVDDLNDAYRALLDSIGEIPNPSPGREP